MILSQNNEIHEKPKLYRYELGGTLVYNSKARIAGDARLTDRIHEAETIPQCANPVKKLLNNANTKGNPL